MAFPHPNFRIYATSSPGKNPHNLAGNFISNIFNLNAGAPEVDSVEEGTTNLSRRNKRSVHSITFIEVLNKDLDINPQAEGSTVRGGVVVPSILDEGINKVREATYTLPYECKINIQSPVNIIRKTPVRGGDSELITTWNRKARKIMITGSITKLLTLADLARTIQLPGISVSPFDINLNSKPQEHMENLEFLTTQGEVGLGFFVEQITLNALGIYRVGVVEVNLPHTNGERNQDFSITLLDATPSNPYLLEIPD